MLVIGLRPPLAGAQSGPEHTAAEVLFEEGRRLMELERYAEACAKFRESQRLDAAAGTLMNLGRCYAKQGRTASAWTAYRQAAALARAGGQDNRERVARREIEALEREFARVRITASPEVRALGPRATLDGVELGRELWDVAMPVDPGEHQVVVEAPGFQAWRLKFSVSPREVEAIEITELKRLPQVKPIPRTEPSESRSETSSGRWRMHHSAALLSAGLGVVALAAGAYLTVSAHEDYDAGRASCIDEVRCYEEGFKLREGAIKKGRFARISFVTGGVALAGGTVLWVTAPALSSADRPSAWSLAAGGVW